MGRALRVVLVMAALIGLFGQTVAVAASPATMAAQAIKPLAMPADCFRMMQDDTDKSAPCDRMTPACIVGMGCSIPLVLDVAPPFLVRAIVEIAAPAWPVAPALFGRSVEPDLHPPSILA